MGLDGRTQRDHAIRIQIRQRRLAEVLRHGAAHVRHATGAAHQHHAIDLGRRKPGIAQGPSGGAEGLIDQIGGQARQPITGDAAGKAGSTLVVEFDLHGLGLAQCLLGLTRPQQELTISGGIERELRLRLQPVRQPAIEIIPAQGRIAGGGEHLEHALAQPQQGDIEGAATQIIDREDPFAALVQPVGDRGRRGFVEQAQHLDPGQARGIAGGLALGVVEIGGHGDDRALQRTAQRCLGPRLERLEDLRGDLHRRQRSARRLEPQRVLVWQQVIGQPAQRGEIRAATSHEALDRAEGRRGMAGLLGQRGATDYDRSGVVDRDYRGQQCAGLVIQQHLRLALAHRRHQRMRGAKVDAYREALGRGLGLLGRLWFEDLQQGHDQHHSGWICACSMRRRRNMS